MGENVTNLKNRSIVHRNARNELLRDPSFLSELSDLASSKGIPIGEAKALCGKYLKEIATSYTGNALLWRSMEALVRSFIINRFDNIYIDKKGFAMIRRLSKESIINIVPSHKSVFDFMVVPYFLVKETAHMPIVLAGEVFSAFPIGIIMRKMAGYFVRRNEGNALYYLVFRHYVMLIAKHGMTHLFFIEGGRNKQGTFSSPKMGILKYIAEAKARHGIKKKILFIPICISYDFVPESDIVVEEKESGKKKHIATSMSRYFSQKKYGNCYLKVGRPQTLPLIGQGDKKAIGALGERIMREIKANLIITPNSILCHELFAHASEGDLTVSVIELQKGFLSCHGKLGKRKADLSHVDPKEFPRYLRAAEQKNLLSVDGKTIRMHKAAVPIIEYYSNNIIHLVG